jgi:chemotaxis protein MotA
MVWQVILGVFLAAGIFLLSFILQVGGMRLGSHLNALMIVLGGTLCAALISYSVKRMVLTLRILRKCMGPQEKGEGLVRAVVHVARNYRRGWDIRHLEKQIEDLPPGLLKTGAGLIAYQCEREKIVQVMSREALCIQSQYEAAGRMLTDLAQIVPSMGLIGTIFNFVRFFGLSTDIQGLAECAAVALLSTLYGVLLARLILAPLARKVGDFTAEETFRMDLIREGILGIRDQEHPRTIQFNLESLLAARETLNQIPDSPKVVLLPPEEIGFEGGRVGQIVPT